MANIQDLLNYWQRCLVVSEDAVHASGDNGIMALAVRRDADTAFAADGDYTPLATDDKGFLKCSIEASTVTLDVELNLADDETMVGVTNDGGTTRTLMAGGITGTQTSVGGYPNVLPFAQYLATQPTLADTNWSSLLVDTRQNLKVTLMTNNAGTQIQSTTTNADAAASSATSSRLEVVTRETAYNGTTFDRVRTIEGASVDTGILAVVDKPSTSANAAASLATSTALESGRVIKASAGNLIEIQGFTTTAQFIQVHNTTAVPANGSVPILSFAVEANKNFYKAFHFPVRFSTGISVCNSTTQATKTLGGSDVWFEAQYM